MKFLIFSLVLLIGCAGTTKQVTTVAKLPTVEERAQELSSKFIEKDLPLVEVEQITNTAGQNGELQVWVEAGKTAPYSGVLVNPEGMAYIISEHEAQKDRADAAVEKQRDLDLSKLNLETAKLIVELETTEKKNTVIIRGRDEEIKRIQELHQAAINESKKPWVKLLIGAGSGLVGAGAGILIGALITN